jgi:hypothetical protein
MIKTGCIRVDSYMGYDEFHYGVYDDDSVFQRNKYAEGKRLGRVSAIGCSVSEALKQARKELTALGCTCYRFIPLRVYEVETYNLEPQAANK